MSYTGFQNPESELKDQLDRVEKETGLETDVFDEIEVIDDLPANVPAATKKQTQPYQKVTLYADPTLLTRTWADKGLTLTHETIHANEMKYQLDSNISELMSEDQRKFFRKKMGQSRDQMEGGTEVLARALFPHTKYANFKGYPYLAKKVQEEAEEKGLDIGRMLEEDQEDITDDLYQDSAYELANDVSEYMEAVEEELSNYSETGIERSNDLEYLLDNEDFYEVPYGDGANQPGNEKDSRVPIEASIDYGNRNNAAV